MKGSTISPRSLRIGIATFITAMIFCLASCSTYTYTEWDPGHPHYAQPAPPHKQKKPKKHKDNGNHYGNHKGKHKHDNHRH